MFVFWPSRVLDFRAFMYGFFWDVRSLVQIWDHGVRGYLRSAV